METPKIVTEIAAGELIDKITILEIKSERISDEGKLANIRLELEKLLSVQRQEMPLTDELGEMWQRLKSVNEEIWDLEDQIRDFERSDDFTDGFIKVARLIYRTNDRRAAIKREINVHSGSELIEEKSYSDY